MKLRDYINGDELNVRYTFLTDDITKGPIPLASPYVDRKAYFDEDGEVKELGAKIDIREYFGGLKITLHATDKRLSEFGLCLPINFMGKKNGGGWQNQYLLNSPYTSKDNANKYCYLTNPNGKNLIIFPKGDCDGWKADYSEYACGHFFVDLEFLASFDKAYKWVNPSCGSCGSKSLELYIFKVPSLEVGLDRMCATLDTCALSFKRNAVKIGEKLTLYTHGNCSSVLSGCKTYIPNNGTVDIEPTEYGLTPAYPYNGDARGMEAVFFAYDDMDSLFTRTVAAIDPNIVRRNTDGNLCEHQCWQAAMTRYMLTHGKNDKYMSMLNEAHKVIMESDPQKAVPRQTILPVPYDGAPAYRIFKSFRIQEQLFGATILTDAYKLTGEKKYLDYFIATLDSVLEHNFDNGKILTGAYNSAKEDYTTVCCLIIPFIDAAIALEKVDTAHCEKYKAAASEIAEYLYGRKGFHTETAVLDITESEMEDGSISCTALSLLYYCAKVKRVDKYIARAKQILDMHEVWTTNTPFAVGFRSSLRWWETFWEGDADGPDLCLGHPWTIWRAEADYWYYYLTGDKDYKEKAFNGFMSNFAKVQSDGTDYSCYCFDYIRGGGFTSDASQIKFEVRQGFPKIVDSGLAMYAFVRGYEVFTDKNIF